MKMIAWRAWYANGRDYPSDHVRFADLPADGVISIVKYFDHVDPSGIRHRQILSGDSRYFWFSGPRGASIGSSNDSEEEILRRYPGAIVKRGMWTDDETMKWIDDQAMAAKEPPNGMI